MQLIFYLIETRSSHCCWMNKVSSDQVQSDWGNMVIYEKKIQSFQHLLLSLKALPQSLLKSLVNFVRSWDHKMLVRIANTEDPDKTAHLKASSAAV